MNPVKKLLIVGTVFTEWNLMTERGTKLFTSFLPVFLQFRIAHFNSFVMTEAFDISSIFARE